ncbi:MAG: peptidylprolyl isomerase [Pseudomonadales bacterium]|nr:peptidylprolyl isomerase [Pseudomonadales bacterium]
MQKKQDFQKGPPQKAKLPNGAQTIGPNSRVKLHFALSLMNGEPIDSTASSGPAQLRVGDGNLLPGFERCILGLSTGDSRRFELSEEQAFGKVNPNNINYIHRDKFADDIQLEPGLMVSFAGVGGELPGIVKSVHEQQILVDFNHPLAGRALVFEVTILDVQEGLLSSVQEF